MVQDLELGYFLTMLKRVYRYDVAPLKSPRLDKRGFLHADAIITKAGVFEYQLPDGTVRRELRPLEEVTKKESMDSLKGAPVTNEHPPMSLTADNARSFAVGHVRDDVENIDGKIKAGIIIHDAKTIQDCMDGIRTQMSGGYHCDVDMTPGVHPEFGAYDSKQMNMDYNHAAVTKQGRQGEDVAMKMDSAHGGVECGYMVYRKDADDPDGDGDDDDDDFDDDEDDISEDAKWSKGYKKNLPDDSYAHVDAEGKRHFPYKDKNGKVDAAHLKKSFDMAKVSIHADKAVQKLMDAGRELGLFETSKQKKDGADLGFLSLSENKEITMGTRLTVGTKFIDLPDTAAELVKEATLKMDSVDELQKTIAKLQGRCDALESDKVKLEDAAKNFKIDDKKALALAKARIEVEEIGKKVLGEDQISKIDSMETVEIKKAICLKLYEDRKDSIEKNGEAYVDGLFDGVRTTVSKEGFRHPDSLQLDSLLGDHAKKINEDRKDGANDPFISSYDGMKKKMEDASKMSQ